MPPLPSSGKYGSPIPAAPGGRASAAVPTRRAAPTRPERQRQGRAGERRQRRGERRRDTRATYPTWTAGSPAPSFVL